MIVKLEGSVLSEMMGVIFTAGCAKERVQTLEHYAI